MYDVYVRRTGRNEGGMQAADGGRIDHIAPGKAEELVGGFAVPARVAAQVCGLWLGALVVGARDRPLRQRLQVDDSVVLEVAVIRRRILKEWVGRTEVRPLQDDIVPGGGYGRACNEVARRPVL